MMLRAIYFIIAFFLSGYSIAGQGGMSPPDPYLLSDTNFTTVTYGYRSTSGLTVRSPSINISLKTLVLITTGQSLLANVVPTLYVPTNSSVIDQINIYDGQLYSMGGPLLGSTYNPTLAGLGPGNVVVRVADLLITNGKFDRVIIADLNIGSTLIAQWGDVNNLYTNRLSVVIARLAARGITPGMTGVTFSTIMAVGNNDLVAGTSQAAYSASQSLFITNTQAVIPSSRIFIALDSGSGQTSNAVRSAQAAAVNGTTIFSGGDLDSSTIATSDGVHPSDAGAATMATIIYNALHASGSPF